jgi:hypothetical protein
VVNERRRRGVWWGDVKVKRCLKVDFVVVVGVVREGLVGVVGWSRCRMLVLSLSDGVGLLGQGWWTVGVDEAMVVLVWMVVLVGFRCLLRERMTESK